MQIETISRGPQFKGFLSTVGLVIFAFTLIFAIVMFVHDDYFEGIIGTLVAFVAFMLFLSIEGMQINHETRQVRAYKELLWQRRGEWVALSNYEELHLVKDNFYVRTGVMPNMMVGGAVNTNYAKISTYDVVLYSKATGANILMSEFPSQEEAIKFMNTYAEKLNLPVRNIFRELQASAVARRASSHRR